MLQSLRKKIGTKWIGVRMHKMIGYVEQLIMMLYKDTKLINLINEVRREDKDFMFLPSELLLIHSLALSLRKLSGQYAEVGVYKGSSAKMICEAKGDKPLYLFDSFEGIPHRDKIDTQYTREQFRAKPAAVKKRLAKYKNVHIYKGVFPGTAGPIKDKEFAFVHLDVDVYKSTKDCLEFFYEKMQKGGVILVHDYSQDGGLQKAVDEFFEDKLEEIIELPMTQCMIVKL